MTRFLVDLLALAVLVSAWALLLLISAEALS